LASKVHGLFQWRALYAQRDAYASNLDAVASSCYYRVVRTTISLPEPLIEDAKQRAVECGVTLSKLMEDALRNLLLAPEPSSSAPPFRLHTVRGKLVSPHLDLDRTSALVVAEDEAAFRGKRP